MTYRELYIKAKQQLSLAGVDSPGEDALALSEHFFGLDRAALALRGDESPSMQAEAVFLHAAAERADRRPLQYILGEWEFMGMQLCVGEGVLVPREDTCVLIEALAERLKPGTKHIGADLCAGTGAVALGLCSLAPDTEITCVELSEQAFVYLEKNLAAHPQFNITAKAGDILKAETTNAFAKQSLDFVASNPPYIKSRELAELQAEVQKEPSLALDGGEDGLVFYRAITELWLPLIKPGGFLAVEISEDQGDDVSALFTAHGLRDVTVLRDWAALDRCVIGQV